MEKLKLLICDDEQNIRQGLKFILDWDALGITICGEAANGTEAVNQIIDLTPDIVILDIKMPCMTGVEVITKIQEVSKTSNLTFPSFIILSGFSDFEYAQQTINLGAKAYLLKPVDEDQLQEKILAISDVIRKSRIQNLAAKNYDALMEKEIIFSLLNGNLAEYSNKLNNFSDFFDDITNASFYVIILHTSLCRTYDKQQYLKSLDNYFSFFNNKILFQDNKIIIIVKSSNSLAVERCMERASKLNPDNTFITAGSAGIGVEGLQNSYKEALMLEKNLFFFDKFAYLTSDKIKQKTEEYSKNIANEIIEKFVFCIETYNKDQLEQECENYKTLLSSIDNVNSIKQELIYCILETQGKLQSKYPERDFTTEASEKIVPTVLSSISFSDCYEYLRGILFELVENFNFNTTDSVIIKVIAYIKSNFDKELKLETLGDQFNCNSAYLGKKFKKYTGVQFNTYLDNIRIENAKDKLINTDLKIYQISKLVGYSNTDYFFMKFKKSTGITPKEFRKKIGKNDEE